MRIHFVRHGESQANLLHEISNRGLRHGLTLKGRRQALALAQRLESVPIMRIYSSPVLRAIETCVLIAHHLEIEYEVTPALREYDCGILEGRSDDEAWRGWQELFDAWIVDNNYKKRIDEGESFLDIRARFEPFIKDLADRFGNDSSEILCVAHGGLYWMMLPLLLKNVNTQVLTKKGLDYAIWIVTELREDGWYCIDWNGQPFDQIGLE
jgi:broad specificity phosphatase PhoE